MRRPEQVAAASPVRTYEGKNNNGTAVISSVEVLNTMDSAPLRMGNATLPLEVRVTGPNALMEYSLTVYDNSSPGAPVAIPSLTGLVYEEGMEIEFEGYKFSIDGVVANGDSYFIEKNTGGKSDNTNFLQMIDLQMAEIVDGNNYQDAYGEMLSWVGIKAQNAELSFKSSTSALSTSESSLESTRGVNLDEEAAKLVKFQQAYSAAAQLITAQQTIFNSLLGAVRG